MTRTITMRSTDRDTAGDSRSLWAFIDEAGALVIHGQDLGPAVGVLGGSSYEWYLTHARADIPSLLVALGAPANANVLDVIEERFCGVEADTFEALVRDSDLAPAYFSWIND